MTNEQLFEKFLQHLDEILSKQNGGDNRNDAATGKD